MSRIKQLFKSFAGAVVIALAIFLLLPSTEVQASYATMTENDPGLTGSTSLEGGPTYRRTGWIFYLLDMEGSRVGSAYGTTCYTDGIYDRNGNTIPSTNTYIAPRAGVGRSVYIAYNDAPWGAPWDDAQNLRGDEVYQWLSAKGDNGHTRAANLIENKWGQEKAQQWENKELVLCFEPFAWFCIYKNNGNAGSPEFASGKWICATVRWLGLIQRGIEGSLKRGDYGSSMIGSITNGVFPNSMVIHPDPILKDLGLAPALHGGKVTNNEMGCNLGWVPDYSYTTLTGWGMGLLVNEVQPINTYSPSQGSPGKAEDPHPDKIGQCTIIKGYYTENLDTGVKTSDGVYVQKETTNKIMISDEPEYKVVSWSTSPLLSTPNPVNWAPPSPTQSGTHAQSVELKTPEKVLYVLLKKEVQDDTPPPTTTYELSESQLTKQVETQSTDQGSNLLAGKFIFSLGQLDTSHSYTETNTCDNRCCGHTTVEPECGYCVTHTHSNTVTHTMALDDKDLYFVAKNGSKDAQLISAITSTTWGDKWETPDGEGRKYERTSTSANSSLLLDNYNYKFIIHRAQKDKAQLYTGTVKHPVGSGTLTPSGLLSMSFTSSAKGTNSRRNGFQSYELNLPFTLNSANSDVRTTSKCTEGHSTTDTDDATMEDFTPSGVTVGIHTYAGTLTGGITDGTFNGAQQYLPADGVGNVGGRMVDQGKSFSFYPYVMMQYDNLNQQKQRTYVVGQYIRTMNVYDYAEIGWNHSASSNLHVTSNQWSTHAGAMALAGANSVLPGGAVYSVDTKNSTQTVTVRTYQTILTGDGLAQVEAAGSVNDNTNMEKLKIDYAKAQHEAFVDSVVASLNSLNIEQYVEKNKDAENAFGGIVVSPGCSISALQNGSSTASNDSKYYLKGSGSGESDSSTLSADKKATTSVSRVFSSDVAGNIYLDGSKILGKGQGASSASGLALQLDKKTKVLTKLVAALERDTGNDNNAEWVSDGHWYNEAFNGVTVLIQTTQIEVGLKDPATRSTVLDPKLIPKGIASNGNSDVSKGTNFTTAFLCQYKTNNRPSGAPNVLGTFAGQQIATRNLDMLFWSNKFYIPDVTVQDLS